MVYDSMAIDNAVRDVARQIAGRHAPGTHLGIIGIANGGVQFGRRLAAAVGALLGHEIPLGTLNAQFHRDDIGNKPIPKAFMRTDIPFDIDDATIILADDVLFSGRTVRAALNEVFDHGRPSRVELAVLADRGGRSLPIAADYVGLRLEAGPQQQVVVILSPQSADTDAVLVESALTTPSSR